MDEFGGELAGFIFTREHHRLTQIFDDRWISLVYLCKQHEPASPCLTIVQLAPDYADLCGLDRGIRFNIINDLGIHTSDHESSLPFLGECCGSVEYHQV